MSAETRIYRIEPGSLIVVPHFMEPDQVQALIADLVQVCGHDRFVILLELGDDGETDVYGADDVIEALEARGIIN